MADLIHLGLKQMLRPIGFDTQIISFLVDIILTPQTVAASMMADKFVTNIRMHVTNDALDNCGYVRNTIESINEQLHDATRLNTLKQLLRPLWDQNTALINAGKYRVGFVKYKPGENEWIDYDDYDESMKGQFITDHLNNEVAGIFIIFPKPRLANHNPPSTILRRSVTH